MTSQLAAAAIKAELLTTYSGPLVEANDFRHGLGTGLPFLLLLFPPTIHRRMNVGQPPFWEETGSFAVRYHIPSGEDVTPGRTMIDGLQSFFRERQFPADDGSIVHTEGTFSGYESDEPEGNWYSMHLVVPFRRQYQGEERP